MIDVLVGQFSETMSTRLMLYQSAEVVRIAISAVRHSSNGSTSTPHAGQAFIHIAVQNGDNQCLVDIVIIYHCSCHVVEHVGHHIIEVHLQSASGSCSVCCIELGCSPDIHVGAHTALVGHWEVDIHIEIVLVGLKRLDGKEIFHALLYVVEISPGGNVLSIVAVANEHDVHTLALGVLMQLELAVLIMLIVELLHLVVACDGMTFLIHFVCQCKDHAVGTVGGAMCQCVDFHRQLCLLITACLIDMHPRRAMGHLPIAIGIENDGACIRLVQQFALHRAANEVAVGGDALKLFPSRSIAIGIDRAFGNDESKIVLL